MALYLPLYRLQHHFWWIKRKCDAGPTLWIWRSKGSLIIIKATKMATVHFPLVAIIAFFFLRYFSFRAEYDWGKPFLGVHQSHGFRGSLPLFRPRAEHRTIFKVNNGPRLLQSEMVRQLSVFNKKVFLLINCSLQEMVIKIRCSS